MRTRDLIVIGGSAGGFSAALTLISALPQDLCASLLLALHAPNRVGPGLCVALNRVGWLPARLARDHAELECGHIYLVPGGMQVRVGSRRLCLEEDTGLERFRPSVDRMFRTAAESHGERVIGVVLSGLMDDGAAGLAAIIRAGGVGVVQSPLEAQFGSMPLCALKAAPESYCLEVGEMAPRLVKLVAAPIPLAVPPESRVTFGD
jgi:two-component system chemotaxis response regulator CheB